MKKMWKKMLIAGYAMSLFTTALRMEVMADELQKDVVVIAAEDPEEIMEFEEPLENEELINAEEIGEQKIDNDEVVGTGSITVGDNITATFDSNTGTVKFYSNGGTLWQDWISESGIEKSRIKAISVVSGIVYLPSYSRGIFYDCGNLTELDLSNFDTSRVTDMSWMFANCINLKKLDLSSFNTSNVTNMAYMFYSCKIENLDLRNFDTSKVTDMLSMFAKGEFLKLDLSSFDTSNLSAEHTYSDGTTESGSELFYDGWGSPYIKKLITPKNNTRTGIRLPLDLYDIDGNKCLELPVLSSKILTYRQDITKCLIVDSPSSYASADLTCVFNGSEIKPQIYVRSGVNILEKGKDYNVSYVNNTNAGTASVIVTGINDWIGNLETNFTIEKAFPVLKFASSSVTKKITESRFINTLTKSTDGIVEFSSSNGDVAFVDNNGMVIVRDVGTAIITVNAKEGENYKSGSASYTLTISKADISSCTVTISPSNYSYNGNEKKPEVTVKGEMTTDIDHTVIYLLALNIDYTVTYENNIDAGKATVKIIGKGNYTGTKSVQFTINKAEPVLKFASSSVIKKTTDVPFTNTLTKTTDGTVSFKSGNTGVATVDNAGRVTIKGEGTTTITVAATEGANYKSGSAGYTLSVVKGSIDISGCTVTLSTTSYTYDGKEKKPTVAVKDGTKALSLDTDYTVTYENNTNAGKGTVKVTGIDVYTGTKTIEFTINKAAPTLKFAADPVRKKPGDAAFTNKLTYKTDGTLTYTSGDKTVATVNSTSGRVTVKGEGRTKITVKAVEGTNYKAGSASYTLTVSDNGVGSCSYSFSNSAESFGYPAGYVIPLEAYYRIYGKNTRAEYTYKTRSQKKWGGNCVGMASTADLLSRGAALDPGMFRSGAVLNSELSPTDKSSALGISLTQLIESFQIMQYTTAFSDERYGNMVATYDILNSGASLDALYGDIKKRTSAGERVILVMAQNGEGHAVLAYGVSEPDSGSAEILIYDNNHPQVERKVTLKKGTSGKYTEWSYDMGSHGVWGTGSFSSYMTYITEATFDRLWENRGNVGKMEADKNIAVTNSRNVAIYNAEGKLEATIVDGKLTTSNEGIMLLDNDISLGKQEQMTYICLPTRTYTVANLDKKITNFDLTMVNTDLGINVSTSAQEVTLAVDDEYAMNTLVMDADASDTYSVTLSNSTGTGYREVVVDGKGQGEAIEISQSGKSIILNNCEIGSLMVDGKKVGVYDITAQTSNGGTVSPQGTVSVMRGGSQKYTITPKSGYAISDVFIDGESVGPVKTYTFKNVTSKHTILATFKKKTQGTTVNGFTDVQDPNHAYYKAIYWAADAGITKGYPDGTFGINRSCTRGEMMMFLWRYAGKPAPKAVSKSPFKDVPKTHTFYKAILWGSQKGITKGYSDGTFGINRNVSRGECMMFLWRLKGKPAPKAVAKAPFPDVPKSHVFYNAVLWGYQKKITTGFTSGKLKGKFGVNENCSRGQIVTFLYRAR